MNIFMADQSWYNNTIVVSPVDENLINAAGTKYIRSSDGGTTWSGVSGGTAHVDAHDLRYQGSTLYVANDGGIWSSTDDLVTTTNRNTTLVTRQLYAISIDATNVNRVLAGAQDNGTMLRQDVGGTAWKLVVGGDGFECAINPANPSIAYATIQFGLVYQCLNAGAAAPAFAPITPPYAGSDVLPFETILTIDANAPSTLYTGSHRVWRTTNGGSSPPTWTALPTTTTDGSTWSSATTVDSIAIARTDSQILMISKSVSVFRSTNGGTSWIKASTGLPGNVHINTVEIDPTDAAIAYVALGTTSGSSIYRTTNGGTSWTLRATGLPKFSAQVVRVDPIDHNDLFAGTDVGVYRSLDAGRRISR